MAAPVLAVISEYSQSVQEQHGFDDVRTQRRLQTFTHRSHDGGLPVEHCREQKAKVRKPERGLLQLNHFYFLVNLCL